MLRLSVRRSHHIMTLDHDRNKVLINSALVRRLVADQFPQWSKYPVTPVKVGGHDNRTFHLGDNMCVRLPSAKAYAAHGLIDNPGQFAKDLAGFLNTLLSIDTEGAPSPEQSNFFRGKPGDVS